MWVSSWDRNHVKDLAARKWGKRLTSVWPLLWKRNITQVLQLCIKQDICSGWHIILFLWVTDIPSQHNPSYFQRTEPDNAVFDLTIYLFERHVVYPFSWLPLRTLEHVPFTFDEFVSFIYSGFDVHGNVDVYSSFSDADLHAVIL